MFLCMRDIFIIYRYCSLLLSLIYEANDNIQKTKSSVYWCSFVDNIFFNLLKTSKDWQLTKMITRTMQKYSVSFLVSTYVFVYNRSACIYLYASYIVSFLHASTYCNLLYSWEDIISWKNLCHISICYI